MIYRQPGSKYYWTKFNWQGKTYRVTTGATDRKTAQSISARIRSEMAMGNFGILQPKEIPTLAEFMKEQFLPYVKSTKDIAPKTKEYYQLGSVHLLASKKLSSTKLTDIDDQALARFSAKNKYSISTLNRNLRTLRHALQLAEKWKVIDRAPKVSIAPGENVRDRVITDEEMKLYLMACLQPWRDIASIMFTLGMRPGEIYALRWEQVDFNSGFIFILRGKTQNSKRQLSIEPVRPILEYRHRDAGFPHTGWVFPADTKSGHIGQGSAKNQHLKAIAAANNAAKEKAKEAGITNSEDKIKAFAPYCLRHTALTTLATLTDSFTLKKIAGHASVRTTQRYVHPQDQVIEDAFAKITERKKVVIAGGHSENGENKEKRG
jgi:integrase